MQRPCHSLKRLEDASKPSERPIQPRQDRRICLIRRSLRTIGACRLTDSAGHGLDQDHAADILNPTGLIGTQFIHDLAIGDFDEKGTAT